MLHFALIPQPLLPCTNRGRVRLQSGNRSGAVADLRNALQLKPDFEAAQELLDAVGEQ